jgi:ankyrin repeat protein
MLRRTYPAYSRDILSRAIARGDVNAIRQAISDGIDCDEKSAEGLTPLMEAARSGRTAIVQLLVSNGVDVGMRTECGVTALMLAASRCRPAIVAILLKNGALIEKNPDGIKEVLHAAAGSGDWASMRLLLEARASHPAKRLPKRPSRRNKPVIK